MDSSMAWGQGRERRGNFGCFSSWGNIFAVSMLIVPGMESAFLLLEF